MLHEDGVLIHGEPKLGPIIGFHTTQIVRVPEAVEAGRMACEIVQAQWLITPEYKSKNRGRKPMAQSGVSRSNFAARGLFGKTDGHIFYSADDAATQSFKPTASARLRLQRTFNIAAAMTGTKLPVAGLSE